VPDAPPARTPLIVALGAAFVPVLFTIGGWQQMNMVAGEVRDPARSIPRALVIGIAIVIAIYLGANVVYLHALGRDGLAVSTAAAADTATRFFGPWGGTFIALAAMVSIFGFIGVAILSNSRIVYAMAADGIFLRVAGRVHPRFGSPHVAIWIIAGWSLVLLFATGADLGKLLDGVVFADWIFFGLGAASVFALRRARPDAERPYRVPGYPWLPAFFVLAAVVGVASSFVASKMISLIGVALLAAGAVAYGLMRRRTA
jgi:APA family basic amino acid/polyamine antiporter